MFSAQNKKKNTFLETKPNFHLTEKCFPLIRKCFLLTNFSNDKQIQKNLESDFPDINFQETNATSVFHSMVRR
jgi:hypothetical protein